MKEKIIDYNKYLKIAQDTDYSNKISVKRHNKAVDDMRKIAAEIASCSNDEQKEFFELLNEDSTTWTAHHILEFFNPQQGLKERCIGIIKEAIEREDINSLGESIWLKEYENK